MNAHPTPSSIPITGEDIGAPATVSAAISPTGEAGAPNLSTSSAWGKQPLCKECGRGFYSCMCGAFAHDDEMMPASDVCRIMGDFFPETGWALAERSAYGMAK